MFTYTHVFTFIFIHIYILFIKLSLFGIPYDDEFRFNKPQFFRIEYREMAGYEEFIISKYFHIKCIHSTFNS